MRRTQGGISTSLQEEKNGTGTRIVPPPPPEDDNHLMMQQPNCHCIWVITMLYAIPYVAIPDMFTAFAQGSKWRPKQLPNVT